MDFNDKISRASLHVEVADRVREMIFEGTLAPGIRIDELDLSAKLGTSRTPLREALKVLANERLVRLAPGRGAFVSEMTGPEVDSLFPVLAMLEGRAAAEAIRRLTPAEVASLDEIQQRMEKHATEGRLDAFHADTDQFHQLLLTIAGNPWLTRVTSDLRNFLRLARSQTRFCDARMLPSLAEHRTLMRSIDRRDSDSVEQIMNHHLMAQQRAWRQWQSTAARPAAERPAGEQLALTDGLGAPAMTSPAVTPPALMPTTVVTSTASTTPATALATLPTAAAMPTASPGPVDTVATPDTRRQPTASIPSDSESVGV